MNIVILATRIAGVDGVSLEAENWREILIGMGYKVTLVAGELDREGIVLPELHFKWPSVAGIHDRVVYGTESYEKVERVLFAMAGEIEGKLRRLFRNGEKCDLLIVPNVFSHPMHFPLAVALSRVIDEFSIKTIVRHHDFWWERKRYNKSNLFHFFRHWFPPNSRFITHTVINSITQKELAKRTKIKAEIISDSFDFSGVKLQKVDSYSKHWKRDFTIPDDDIVFLQPTRIVPRKRVELSIELIHELNLPEAILVITGYEGDEQVGYKKMLEDKANSLGIRHRFIGDRINSHRKIVGGKRIYTLWDCYVNCDFVTYPTEVEGFGNQFIEAMYYKKPIIITPYPVFQSDIRRLGFGAIEMSNKVTKDVIKEIKLLIKNPNKKKAMVEKNYKLAKKHYSYEAVEKKLKKLFALMKV
ncbi:MAG: glycosyltransferase [Candidatus Hodarchaeales archaeon]|jgi:glycosyltransferase involved in cell wall biosynthesis